MRYLDVSGNTWMYIIHIYIYLYHVYIYIYMDAVYLNDFDDVRGCFRRLGTRKVFF